jgi:hypothetical protein
VFAQVGVTVAGMVQQGSNSENENTFVINLQEHIYVFLAQTIPNKHSMERVHPYVCLSVCLPLRLSSVCL